MFERSKSFFKKRGNSLKNTTKKVFNTEEISQHGSWISEMWKSAIGKKRGQRREESFQNAYIRLGLTEEKLAMTHRYYYFRFYLFSLMGAIGIGIGVYSALTHQWVTIGTSIGFLAICLSMMFNASFRLYQIERRELIDVGAWWRAKSSWIPAPFSPAKTSVAPQKKAKIHKLSHHNPAGK